MSGSLPGCLLGKESISFNSFWAVFHGKHSALLSFLWISKRLLGKSNPKYQAHLSGFSSPRHWFAKSSISYQLFDVLGGGNVLIFSSYIFSCFQKEVYQITKSASIRSRSLIYR